MNYYDMTKEELQEEIKNNQEDIKKLKEKLSKISIDEEKVKSLKEKEKNLNEQIAKIEKKINEIYNNSKALFWEKDGFFNEPEFRRQTPYYRTTTNIYDDVIDAIKKHVKISKLKQGEVENLVLELHKEDMRRNHQEEIEKLSQQKGDLFQELNEILNEIHKESEKKTKITREIDSKESTINFLTSILENKDWWKKKQKKEKKEEENMKEYDHAFSEETISKIYEDVV